MDINGKEISKERQLDQKLEEIGIANTTRMSLNVAYLQIIKKQVTFDKEIIKQMSSRIIKLNESKMDMLLYLEMTIRSIAPNVCEIIGPRVTSKLVATAGGIVELSRIPACNIQVLGQERRALNGFSAAEAGIHRGHLNELEMVRNAPDANQT